MDIFGPEAIEELLRATGDLLATASETAAVVVVGGATLSIRGFVDRVTKYVDVIALAEEREGNWHLVAPVPLPGALARAVATVARDFGVADDWLNAVIGAQWLHGLPSSLPHDIDWRAYGGLTVGFVGRQALIALKLFAAVDNSPTSVHYQDLVALRPTRSELETAAEWVAGQDAGPAFAVLLNDVIETLHDQD